MAAYNAGRRVPRRVFRCIDCEDAFEAARKDAQRCPRCVGPARDQRWAQERRRIERAGDLTRAAIAAMLRNASICTGCGEVMTDGPGPRQKNLDHILPILIGGPHIRANVRIICRRCNIVRGNLARRLFAA